MKKHPKGGMCATCTKVADDCSALPFNNMRPAAKNSDAVICTEYRRKNINKTSVSEIMPDYTAY